MKSLPLHFRKRCKGCNAGNDCNYFLPITEHRYTSLVGVRVISPDASASKISVSEVSSCGVNPGLNWICTSCQSGLKPSPWIASSTETNPEHASHMYMILRLLLLASTADSPPGGSCLKLIVKSSSS